MLPVHTFDEAAEGVKVKAGSAYGMRIRVTLVRGRASAFSGQWNHEVAEDQAGRAMAQMHCKWTHFDRPPAPGLASFAGTSGEVESVTLETQRIPRSAAMGPHSHYPGGITVTSDNGP
jgi:hypothetical protein